MPHRRLWNHLISPLTFRAVLFFVGFCILAYLLIDNYEQRQQRQARWAQVDRIIDTWPEVTEQTKQTHESTDQIKRNTEALVVMAQGMSDIAAILHSDRETRTREHQELMAQGRQQQKAVRSIPRTSKRRIVKSGKCYDELERREQYGDSVVITRDLIPRPCR